jgi:GTP cyclohydrolase I
MSNNVRRLVLSRRSNEAFDAPLEQIEEVAMIDSAARKMQELLDVLRIDYRNDHNTRDTPRRVAKMYVQELLRGRFQPPPTNTEFDKVERCDQLIVTGPIDVRSTCAHHLMPIYGHAFIGILPADDGKIIGLSKYDRIVDHFSARLQIQEELVKQIGNFVVEKTRPRGLAVRISAVHMCKTQRGVRAGHESRMVNTAFYGDFLTDANLKSEFQQECRALECRN